MLRLPAILLAAVLSLLLIAPGSYLSAASRVPACCRAHGIHKCAMGADEGHASDAGLSIRALCPLAGHQQSGSMVTSRLAIPVPASAMYAEIVSHPAVCPQTEALSRISWLRCCQKRGPPASQS